MCLFFYRRQNNMAYKFQRGPAVASGSFTAEEGLTSNNALSVTAGTSTLQAVSLSTVTGSGLAQFQSLTVNGGTSTFSTVDINGGAIDGVTIGTSTAVTQFTASNSSLGAAVASSLNVDSVSLDNNILSGLTQLTSSNSNLGAAVATSLVTTTVRATNYKANDDTAAITIADSTGAVTISSDLIANGNITLGNAGTDIITVAGVFTSSLNPNVTGQNDLGITTKLWRNVKAQYLSSSIDLLVGGAATVANGLTVTAGTLTAATVDINGGAIDGTAIGAAAQSTGQFTTLSASSNLQVGSSITASSGIRVSSGGVTVTDGGLTVSNGDSSVQKLTVNGDLIVLGNTFSASVGTLVIEDKQIVLADGAADRTVANGAGFFVSGASVQWTYKNDGEGAAASSSDIFVASSSAGLIDIQAANFYGTFNGSLIGSMASTVSASVGGATLVTGVNYFSTVGGAVSVTLPASADLTVGNSVKVKAGSDCSTTNTITINKTGSQTIDGETFVVLESPWAALEFVYVASDTWRIF